GVKHIGVRLKACFARRAFAGVCPIGVGWKTTVNLGLIPQLAQEFTDQVTFIHLLRDGRDIMTRNMKEEYTHLFGAVAHKTALMNQGPQIKVGKPKDINIRIQFWSKLNMQVMKCAQRMLPQANYIQVRIEDFVMGNLTQRGFHIFRLAQKLGVTLNERQVGQLLSVFDLPINTDSKDFVEKHYGAWRNGLIKKKNKRQIDGFKVHQLEMIGREGLEKFGYVQRDGMDRYAGMDEKDASEADAEREERVPKVAPIAE
ncbi:hypothetical protein CYMTET_11878, partial [Cymbomonas tetramitiformis]